MITTTDTIPKLTLGGMEMGDKAIGDFERMMNRPLGTQNYMTVPELFGNIEATYRMAKALAAGMGYGTAEHVAQEAFAKIINGAEMGIGPAASIRGLYIVPENTEKKRPPAVGMFASLMMGLAQSEGWDFVIEHSDPVGEWCEVTANCPGCERKTFRYTMAMARKAGNADKWTYKSQPHAMLQARASAIVARMAAPARLSGVYSPEELDGNDRATRIEPNATPDADQSAAADSLLDEVTDFADTGRPLDPPAPPAPPETDPTVPADHTPPTAVGDASADEPASDEPAPDRPADALDIDTDDIMF